MNELTDAQIAQSLEWLRDNAESAKDFTLEQAPLYFQELIRYEIIMSSIWTLVGAAFLAVALWLAKKAFETFREDGEVDAIPWVGMAFVFFRYGFHALVDEPPKAHQSHDRPPRPDPRTSHQITP